MSTSYGQRTLTLPRRQVSLTAASLVAAAMLAGFGGIAYLFSQQTSITAPPSQMVPIERPAFRGEMEYPGIETTVTGNYGSGLRLHTLRGGLAEFAGVEPAPAKAGQALGGEQEFAVIR